MCVCDCSTSTYTYKIIKSSAFDTSTRDRTIRQQKRSLAQAYSRRNTKSGTEHCTLTIWHHIRILCAFPLPLSRARALSISQANSHSDSQTDNKINDCHLNLIYLINELDTFHFNRFHIFRLNWGEFNRIAFYSRLDYGLSPSKWSISVVKTLIILWEQYVDMRFRFLSGQGNAVNGGWMFSWSARLMCVCVSDVAKWLYAFDCLYLQ